MRFNRLDLNLLVVLDALLTEQNITRAGQQVFLSQSATSGALARLREFFNDELLVQVGRKMVLTPLGESLVKPVRSILLQVQTTIEQRPEFDPTQSQRKFTFIMSDYTAMVLMPAVVRQAAQIAPGITFELITPTDAPIEELENGNADFLLLPSNAIAEKHPSCSIFSEDFVCICCRDNQQIEEEITTDQYLKLGHVIVSFGSLRRPSVDTWLLEKYGIDRRPEITVPTFTAVPQYVIGTSRIATIHRRLANFWAKHLPIRILPTPIAIPTMDWSLQWHQYKDIDPATHWVKQMIQDTAADMY
ncbi:LysR family transcriptional regulator [Vogesella sp. GCM10023246]|uniref:LysR family transcriptional regulator n=1 Tax=Vogesella oryzagri TaxID=3160864 RepID=A0ABV1M2W8_9NEIS